MLPANPFFSMAAFTHTSADADYLVSGESLCSSTISLNGKFPKRKVWPKWPMFEIGAQSHKNKISREEGEPVRAQPASTLEGVNE